MDKNRVFKKRARRRSASFNPNHQYIEDSIQEYLKRGGKITRIERVNGSYENFVSIPDALASADDFLFDR